jgi:hypothetical protein
MVMIAMVSELPPSWLWTIAFYASGTRRVNNFPALHIALSSSHGDSAFAGLASFNSTPPSARSSQCRLQ